MTTWTPVNEVCTDTDATDTVTPGVRCDDCNTHICSHGYEHGNEWDGYHVNTMTAVHYPHKLHDGSTHVPDPKP